MLDKKPHFLITNDDGIFSTGLRQLWEALKDHAKLTIVAPDTEKSGAALGMTYREPLKVTPVKWKDASTHAYMVSGTPVDCVRVAIKTLHHTPFDMVLSGINHGHNSGRTVLYSGTVGGVIQGVYYGIPGIAFSHFREDSEGFGALAPYIWPIVDYFSQVPTPKGTFYNVNFPNIDERIVQGCKLATQGFSTYDDHLLRVDHADGSHLLHPQTFWRNSQEPETSDVYWLNKGFITIAPIKVEELTDKEMFNEQRDRAEKHFSKLFPLNNNL